LLRHGGRSSLEPLFQAADVLVQQLYPGLQVLHLGPDRVLLLERDRLLQAFLDAAQTRAELQDLLFQVIQTAFHTLESDLDLVQPNLYEFEASFDPIEPYLDLFEASFDPIESYLDLFESGLDPPQTRLEGLVFGLQTFKALVDGVEVRGHLAAKRADLFAHDLFDVGPQDVPVEIREDGREDRAREGLLGHRWHPTPFAARLAEEKPTGRMAE